MVAGGKMGNLGGARVDGDGRCYVDGATMSNMKVQGRGNKGKVR